ncbi:actophorin-like [Octopus vulgaris]|uniref:Actophorin-like n=2 Tax=Octopus TaxID=6643 RepID=A0AA36F9X3_OCTVU|nr:actophorin [Octopus sinensis]CAI9730025.1 actophorin-like [Octopus vulgaris]
MSSGVTVADEVLDAFQEIKLKHKHRYVIFRLSEDLKSIVVEERAEKDKTYQDFVEKLQCAAGNHQCRYGVFDMEYKHNDMCRQKLAFFLWSPECATIKQKMIYTSSKACLKSKLQGVGVEIQATDDSELEQTVVLEKCRDKSQ